jgi:hypothetical protein
MSHATAGAIFVGVGLVLTVAAALIVRRYLQGPGRGFD